MGAAPLRVVLVDDHDLVLRGLELMLPTASEGALEVVGTTDDASRAAALVRHLVPDLALVDLLMPEPGGLRAIAAVRRTEPHTRIVALSGTDDVDLACAALEAGAEAFLPKTSGPEALVEPLLAVARGFSVMPVALLHRLQRQRRPDWPHRDLGGQERLLWRLLAQGRTSAEMASALHVSERTAKRMVASLLRRLAVGTRAEAAELAGRVGLLEE